MKLLAGWHILACVAAALALHLAVGQSRVPVQCRGNSRPTTERTLVWHGPIMQIDPQELARAGREREDNGLGMRFCWCPPGTFRMGSVPPYFNENLSDGPVAVTLS